MPAAPRRGLLGRSVQPSVPAAYCLWVRQRRVRAAGMPPLGAGRGSGAVLGAAASRADAASLSSRIGRVHPPRVLLSAGWARLQFLGDVRTGHGSGGGR